MGLKEVVKYRRWYVFADETNTIPTGYEIRRLKGDDVLYGILKADTRFLLNMRHKRIEAYKLALKMYKERGNK